MPRGLIGRKRCQEQHQQEQPAAQATGGAPARVAISAAVRGVAVACCSSARAYDARVYIVPERESTCGDGGASTPAVSLSNCAQHERNGRNLRK